MKKYNFFLNYLKNIKHVSKGFFQILSLVSIVMLIIIILIYLYNNNNDYEAD